jgi:hypothetical protein
MPGIKKSSSAKKSGKSGKKPSAAASAMASQAAQSALVRAAVPQWFRLDPDQVPNNAGGFVWQIKLTTKLTLSDLEALRQPPPPRDITPIIDIENAKVEARRDKTPPQQ